MIIRFPTGLYQDAGQLPIDPEDVGNVTFVISNDEPSRSTALTLQLPVHEEIRKRDPLIFSDLERRASFGELVFTLVEANRNVPGSNRKTFAVGDLLDFEDEEVDLPETPSVSKQINLQHNTNILDLEDAGLTNDEIASLTIEAANRKKELQGEVTALQTLLADLEVAIIENQKRINETKKIINAVTGINPEDPLLDKLNVRQDELAESRDALIIQFNETNALISTTVDSLVKVSELVR